MKRYLLLLAAAASMLLPLTNVSAQDVESQVNQIHFNLTANPKFTKCIAQYPNDPNRPPTATVSVQRGNLNDTLTLTGKWIKPNLQFDLFTVEKSSLLSDGTADPNFTTFGLAWYQSDVQASSTGTLATTTVKSILLDQIFGFDADLSNPDPINTFHVGFWFNNPNDAVACGFDANTPTPFNGEHKAGPVAMISVPNATTNLGPLCTNPDLNTDPISCNP
jgi:hypothetical protein